MLLSFLACDQLEEDQLPKDVLDQNTILNNSNYFAIPGQTTIIDVLGNPQEAATIKLISESAKSEVSWLTERLMAYKANKEASGTDYLVFDINTSRANYLDTIAIHLGDSSQFATDSCMPYAASDLLLVNANGTGETFLMSNDQFCNYDLLDFEIAKGPQYGSLTVDADYKAIYTASSSFGSTDSFIYKLSLDKANDTSAMQALYAVVDVYEMIDSICSPSFKTGFSQVDINQSIVEINVFKDDYLCLLDIKQVALSNFSLGNVMLSDSNTVLFEPSQIGLDSLQFTVTLSDETSYQTAHLIEVLGDTTTCTDVIAISDTVALNFPASAVVEVDVLLNDVYCQDVPAVISLPDSASLLFGHAEVIDKAGQAMVRYYADSVSWQNNVSESFRYTLCQGNICSDNYLTVTK